VQSVLVHAGRDRVRHAGRDTGGQGMRAIRCIVATLALIPVIALALLMMAAACVIEPDIDQDIEG
jgi:hypothetical protein